jgi:hypothetical protein
MKKYNPNKKIGSGGSISLHWCGTLVSIFPLTKKRDFEFYKKKGEDAIIRHLREGFDLKRQIKIMLQFCSVFTHRRRNGFKVASYDHDCFCQALFGLLKLKVINNDDTTGYLCLKRPKKRPKRI